MCERVAHDGIKARSINALGFSTCNCFQPVTQRAVWANAAENLSTVYKGRPESRIKPAVNVL